MPRVPWIMTAFETAAAGCPASRPAAAKPLLPVKPGAFAAWAAAAYGAPAPAVPKASTATGLPLPAPRRSARPGSAA